MTQGTLTREEFRGTMDRLYETTDQGFRTLTERLDTLNGRTLKGEIADAELRTRVVSLEKEVFSVPRRRREGAGEDPAAPTSVTKREAALIALGVAVISALVKATLIVGEFAVAAIKATGKH